MSHRADCTAALPNMPSVKSDACAKVHAQEGLWRALRSVLRFLPLSVCVEVYQNKN